jgi:hypothetical protein
MKVYVAFGRDRAKVANNAGLFAQQNNGKAGPVETLDHAHADNLDNNKFIDSGGAGPVYLCRVDY